MQAIKMALRPPSIPGAFTEDLQAEKLARAYAHVYDHYGSQSAGAPI